MLRHAHEQMRLDRMTEAVSRTEVGTHCTLTATCRRTVSDRWTSSVSFSARSDALPAVPTALVVFVTGWEPLPIFPIIGPPMKYTDSLLYLLRQSRTVSSIVSSDRYPYRHRMFHLGNSHSTYLQPEYSGSSHDTRYIQSQH